MAQAINLLSPGSSPIQLCPFGLSTKRIFEPFSRESKSLLTRSSRSNCKRPRTSKYSLRIGLETHRISFPENQYSTIRRGMPPKKEETKTFVSITTFIGLYEPL